MKEIMSKEQEQVIPFEPAVKSNQKFYDELANMPSASKGKKTYPIAVKRLVEDLKSDN